MSSPAGPQVNTEPSGGQETLMWKQGVSQRQMCGALLVWSQKMNKPGLGGSVSCSIIPVPQKGCGFDSQLGWVRKATDLSLKKDNNKSINRSLDKDFF